MQITDEVRKYLSELGKKGGKIGGKISKGGGRPRIPDDQMTELQKKRRERYLKLKEAKTTAR